MSRGRVVLAGLLAMVLAAAAGCTGNGASSGSASSNTGQVSAASSGEASGNTAQGGSSGGGSASAGSASTPGSTSSPASETSSPSSPPDSSSTTESSPTKGTTSSKTELPPTSTSKTVTSTTITSTTTKPTKPAVKPPHQLWKASKLKVLTQPVRVGKYVAIYTLVDHLFQIAVINPANGHVVWKAWASPGAITPGVVVTPEVLGSDVVYLSPATLVDDNYYSTYVVVADGATGKIKSGTKSAYYVTATPHACGKRVCFEASERYLCPAGNCFPLWKDNAVRDMTYNPSTGGSVAKRRTDAGNSREIGNAGLSDVRVGDTEYLARVTAKGVMWRKPESELFGPGYSTDYGWTFDHLAAKHLFVGSIGYDEGGQHATMQTDKHSKLIAVDDRTGKRRWSRPGESQFCLSNLPTSYSVACHFGSGSKIVWEHGDYIMRHTTVSLKGFNPTTGKTTWTIPLASPTGMKYAKWLDSMRPVGEHGLLVRGRSGLVVVNLLTGKTTPLGQRNVLCPNSDEVRMAQSIWSIGDGTTLYTRTIDTSITPCTPTGKAIRPTSPLPSWAGAQAGDIRVVLTKGGLVGYRQAHG